jgi:ABC-type phosphate transport system substrate-binding protein/tRNA A-37 threonylcarbamoyl transferase component Bud32
VLAPLSDDDPRTIGPFTIESRLGAGAMGRVYLGRTATGTVAAIKLVRAELADDAEFRRRFRQEVDAVGRVVGPHTAALVGADTEAARPWLATEYLPGLSLRDVVAQRGPLPTAEVLRLATGIAAALSAIHAAGVVHRDLKPGNVILLPDGPRVIDFGIARAADATALTATGVTIGTPPFLSPEQIDGDEVGPAADVFALGGLLTYLATGRTPFGDGHTGVILHRITHGEPKLAGIEEPLLSLIRSCLAKDPSRRPTPARLAAPEPGTTPTPHPTALLAPRPARRRVSLALGAAGVLAAAAVFVPIAIDRQTEGTPVGVEAGPHQKCGGAEGLTAAGTSLANTAMSAVGNAYTEKCPGKSVAYQPFGTGAAIGDLTSGAATVAIIDRKLTDGERSSAGCEVREVPYLALPVVLPFHLTGVGELRLDAGTLGGIFGGRITRWNDEAIVARNPDTPLPATAITPVVLGDDEPTTEVFRSYAGGLGPGGELVESDAAVRARVNGIEGAIGYAAATAHDQGPFVTLDGAAPTVDAVAATVADTPEVRPYPLVSLTYAVACADDGQATEFLLAGLDAQGDATDFVLPAGEWADRVRAALQ